MNRFLLLSLCAIGVVLSACGKSDTCVEDSDCFSGEVCDDSNLCVAGGSNDGTSNNGSTNNHTSNGTASNSGTSNATTHGASNNQTSNNTSTNNQNNETTGPEARFATLIAGDDYSCALEHNGALWCWGNNANDQLSVEVDDSSVRVPEKVVGVDGIVEVAGGRHHRCALKEDGTVWCWGRNNGIVPGDSTSYITEPTEMPLSDIARVEMGWDAACALETDGTTLSCWGTTDADLPPQFDEEIVDFAVGEDHSCAIVASGDVRCWGSDYYDQIGTGDPVRGISNVSKIVTANRHTCAVTTDGAVYCWGWNDEGQCGSIPVDPQEKFDMPQLVEGIDDAIDVFAGQTYSCALRTAGKLSCWGGIQGLEPTEYVERDLVGPTSPFGLGKDVGLVGAGRVHTCAEKEDDVWCWGDNSNEQLGDGGDSFRAEQPVRVEFPASI